MFEGASALRILFIGDLNNYTESKSKRDALVALGLRVKSLSTQRIPYYPGLGTSDSLLNKVLRKITPMADPTRVNAQLIELAKTGGLTDLDCLWSDKALVIKPSTLGVIRENAPHLKLIFASGDNMAVPDFRNKAFEQSISMFDAVITAKCGTSRALEQLGARAVFYMPKAFDETWPGLLKYPTKRWGISFIGSFEKERASSMMSLAEENLEVNIWGNGWSKLLNKHPKLIVHGYPVYYTDMIRVIEETEINLCFLRKLAFDRSTNRTFEIPACRGFMIAEDTREQRKFFQADVEAVFFKSDAELANKCKYYAANSSERVRIAENAHNKCLTAGYGYGHRCKYFFDNIWPLITR